MVGLLIGSREAMVAIMPAEAWFVLVGAAGAGRLRDAGRGRRRHDRRGGAARRRRRRAARPERPAAHAHHHADARAGRDHRRQRAGGADQPLPVHRRATACPRPRWRASTATSI
ncbi:MAG: hypothetical protein MZW92_38820 [Comamonadaceae bacterium]|nr:hypothetical protein [Comamonadaceae bacterium]